MSRLLHLPPAPPRVSSEEAKSFAQAVFGGDRGCGPMIRRSLRETPGTCTPSR